MVKDIKLNPYYPEYKFRSVPDLDERLKQDYDYVFDKTIAFPFALYPRLLSELGIKFVFRDIYYCIDRLYESNPRSIIDIGCGVCHWKKYFPNIYGIDAEWIEGHTMQDSREFFDASFAIINRKKFESGMMINTVKDINPYDLVKRIDIAMQLVTNQFLFTFGYSNIDNEVELIRKTLDKLPYKLTMFDYTSYTGRNLTYLFDYFVNGNVKFILEHTDDK